MRSRVFIRDGILQDLGQDLSPHDLRLAPLVTAVDATKFLDPLVNMGVDSSAGTLRSANFLNITQTPDTSVPPGLQGPGSRAAGKDTEFAAMHAWDCEGFANPRIFARPGFPAPPQHSTDVDIGADELGNLIIGKFLPNTRTFSRAIPDGSGGNVFLPIPDHTRVCFFDLPAPFGPGTYPRPFFSAATGGRVSSPAADYSRGLGDVSPGPDVIPDSSWVGVRYNCELKIGRNFGFSNLQTFLAVHGIPPADPPPCVIGPKRAPPAKRPLPAGSAPDLEKDVRRRLRRR